MPRYHFLIRWPDHIDEDDEGTVLPSEDAAARYAQRIINELREAGGYDDPSLTLHVNDEWGRAVFSIPF
jgi:hypothetical protein